MRPGKGVRDVFPHEGAKAERNEGAKGTGCRRARRREARSAAAGGGGLLGVVPGNTRAELRRVVERLVRGN